MFLTLWGSILCELCQNPMDPPRGHMKSDQAGLLPEKVFGEGPQTASVSLLTQLPLGIQWGYN